MVAFILCKISVALRLFLLLSIFLGGVYPLAITLIANLISPYTAQGSWILDSEKKARASSLLLQEFKGAGFFVSFVESTSGLDPFIRLEDALVQMQRITAERGIAPSKGRDWISLYPNESISDLLNVPLINTNQYNITLAALD